MAALPFSPLKFSGQIERDLALERRKRLPRWRSSPLNPPSAAGRSGALSQQSARTTISEHSTVFFASSMSFSFRDLRYRNRLEGRIQRISTISSYGGPKNTIDEKS